MKPLSKVAPGTLVIQVQIQAVWERGFLFQNWQGQYNFEAALSSRIMGKLRFDLLHKYLQILVVDKYFLPFLRVQNQQFLQ